jgi:hypothetical protein
MDAMRNEPTTTQDGGCSSTSAQDKLEDQRHSMDEIAVLTREFRESNKLQKELLSLMKVSFKPKESVPESILNFSLKV